MTQSIKKKKHQTENWSRKNSMEAKNGQNTNDNQSTNEKNDNTEAREFPASCKSH